jgi:hypothetical protein
MPQCYQWFIKLKGGAVWWRPMAQWSQQVVWKLADRFKVKSCGTHTHARARSHARTSTDMHKAGFSSLAVAEQTINTWHVAVAVCPFATACCTTRHILMYRCNYAACRPTPTLRVPTLWSSEPMSWDPQISLTPAVWQHVANETKQHILFLAMSYGW